MKIDSSQNNEEQNKSEHEAQQVMMQSLQKAVLLIGGMAISRAINDEALAEKLLAACQNKVLE